MNDDGLVISARPVAAYAAPTGEGVAARQLYATTAFASAVRRLALAKARENPKGGLHGCRPFFIGTGIVPYEKSLRRHRTCGLVIQREHFSLVTFLLLL
jgi:hypothetical protein